MFNQSRTDIYNYLYEMFYGTVTENVYMMNEPQELSDDDTLDGFIVLNVGGINDESEFTREAYGRVRCFVTAYVPPMSKGRLDVEKYKAMEDSINAVVESAIEAQSGDYYVEEDSLLSSDADEAGNADNLFFTFIKSFVVVIDK